MDAFMENFIENSLSKSKEYNSENAPLEKNGVQRFFWKPIIIGLIVFVLFVVMFLISGISF